MTNRPVTVVELAEFQRAASNLFAADELDALKVFLAYQPSAGVLIQGTGGVRKLRWGMQGRGKRGGARVIYYFHSEAMPLFLVTTYAKSRQPDLPASTKRALAAIAKELAETFLRRRRR